MFHWNFDSNRPIRFFSKRQHENNLQAKLNGSRWFGHVFNEYYSQPPEFRFSEGYVVDINYDTDSYKNNFYTGTINKGSVLFFDEDSRFPRTKLSVAGIKRCIKKDKATYIVLKEPTEIKKAISSYIIFEDSGGMLYAIPEPEFVYYFQNSISNMENALKESDGPLGIVGEFYRGRIKGINSQGISSFVKFRDGDYTVPFITDNQLDLFINNTLPDPTIDELTAIREMLNSQDKAVVKLGAQMIAGYNVNKWPLTFRLLLMCSWKWANSYYGGNSVVIKQLKSALNIHKVDRWFGWIVDSIEEPGVTYTKDDCELAKDLARHMDEVKDYCKRAYHPLTQKFIPDEYKSLNSD